MNRRDHFAVLDGLRGLAAISVVLFHVGHWLQVPSLAANSNLAVDFFFCLSGYVLALAYERPLKDGLGTVAFLKIRLIRMMPLIVLATIISFIFALVRVFAKHQDVSAFTLVTTLVFGLLNIPFLGAPHDIGGPEVFPLNMPQYSLFLELLVNLAWCQMRRFGSVFVPGCLALACFVVMACVGVGGAETETFWLGFPRVGGSFFLGVFLFSLQAWTGPLTVMPRVFWTLLAFAGFIFYIPYELPLAGQMVWIVILSPMLVVTGSHVQLSGAVRRWAIISGEMSFPIYALHYPIFCWVNGLYQTGSKRQDIWVETPLTLVAVLWCSHLALKYYDRPIRRWLVEKQGKGIGPDNSEAGSAAGNADTFIRRRSVARASA